MAVRQAEMVEQDSAGRDAGREARRLVPRSSHGDWTPEKERPDPVALLEQQAVTRVPNLVPIRHGRMAVSPFAFYRGAAIVMANDLGAAMSSGLGVQLCGDAHASNFGMFGTPERQMVFDINDFDETTRGPFEWDLKRLAVSMEIAARALGMPEKSRREVTTACARSYRLAMRQFAELPSLLLWYARLDADVLQRWKGEVSKQQVVAARRLARKAKSKDSARAIEKLTTSQDGELRFRSEPPLLVPIEEFAAGEDRGRLVAQITELLGAYEESLRPDLHRLLSSYRLVDIAHKVVGVGSVGLRAWVILLLDRHNNPLVLQAKEAQASVLEAFAGASEFSSHGERVVQGQRTMQSSSDVLLGWLTAEGLDGVKRDFYLRQLWDWKGGAEPAEMLPTGLRVYGEICGWTLARAHARSGDASALSAYVGSSPTLDVAIGSFASRYADQNDKDYAAFLGAIRDGRITAEDVGDTELPRARH